MKSLTEAKIKEMLEQAYNLGLKDRTSYHDQGSNYWVNVTRKQHGDLLIQNRNETFDKMIEESSRC